MVEVTEEMRRVVRVELTGSVFIIPNDAYSLRDIPSAGAIRRVLNSSNAIGHPATNKEKVIQVWVHIGGVTDNLHDHGCSIDLLDGKILHIPSGLVPLIPEGVFDGKVEGDAIRWILQFYSDEQHSDVEVILHLTLNQLGSRYSRFGRFEDVVNYVCS